MSTYIGKRYKLLKLIGKGGMADVYLALDTILNREVAIKVLKDEMASDAIALERFNREAKSSACLMHPNIVEIYDVGDDQDKHYIVMEYIKGYTLKKLIEVRGAIPYKETIWLIKQLALALLEAHKNGIIHRDVKSQNVLIKDDGTVKMADFGIAQAVNDIELTHADTIIGSVHYLAPELSKGKQATMQSDIYALGIVMYEMLTGTLPFKGDSAVNIALQHVSKQVPSVRDFNPQIPQAVENIITKATAKSLENRYSNIALLIQDLNECLKDEHKNDAKISFDNKNANSEYDIFDKEETKTTVIKKKGSKLVNRFGVFGLICLTILSICALVAILLISGVIGKPIVEQETRVPDIKGITMSEASDILDKYNLKVDYSSVERIMTEDIKEGQIISSDPQIGDPVSKGAKIKLVISKGIYSKMENYVGQNVDTVRQLLANTLIKAKFVAVESEYPSGQVISQSIKKDENYDPNEITEVTFEYSKENILEIKVGEYKGKNVDEVYDALTLQEIKVEKVVCEKVYFTSEEQEKYAANTIVRIEPDEGSFYMETSEKPISIYYYVED